MSRRADERGMTLIEVMLGVAILGIIIVPIGAALMLGFMTSSGTRELITDSSSVQLLASYASTDIQSAKWVIGVPSPAPGVPCSGSGAPLLRLEWEDPATAEDTIVVYEQRSTASEGPSLHRVRCDGSGQVRDESRLVRSLSTEPSGPPGFAVTCTRDDGSTGCPTAREGDVAAPVRKVTLDVRIDNPAARDSAYEAREFRIEATRRVTTVAV
ncbi:MAG: type II secretion system protein J [Acidimicrobiia bacterium]